MAPPPPPDPQDYISDAKKDKAPLTVASLFPGQKLTMGDRVYAKGATHRTTNCAATAQGALGSDPHATTAATSSSAPRTRRAGSP